MDCAPSPSKVPRPMEPRESKVRELLVPLYSEERRLGRLHTALHTDARTVVSALAREVSGRGKPIKLAPERLARVDAALREDGAFEGIPALRDAIRTWREDSRLKGDAQSINAYYDAQRTKAYTEKLVRPQAVLATRCLELSGLDSSDSPLVLDLGCGSGLSIEPLQRKGCTVIGVDLSLEMLRAAHKSGMEVIQADISEALPLRSALFDAIFSVSALQFLCDSAGRSAENRAETCFDEAKRLLTRNRMAHDRMAHDRLEHDRLNSRVAMAVFQFHPENAEVDPLLLLHAASGSRADGSRAGSSRAASSRADGSGGCNG